MPQCVKPKSGDQMPGGFPGVRGVGEVEGGGMHSAGMGSYIMLMQPFLSVSFSLPTCLVFFLILSLQAKIAKKAGSFVYAIGVGQNYDLSQVSSKQISHKK